MTYDLPPLYRLIDTTQAPEHVHPYPLPSDGITDVLRLDWLADAPREVEQAITDLETALDRGDDQTANGLAVYLGIRVERLA